MLLTSLSSSPYDVLRHGLKSVDIALGIRTGTVSVDHLKPYIAKLSARVAKPPQQGRPSTSATWYSAAQFPVRLGGGPVEAGQSS
jgi:hypothetical protein